MTEDQQNNTRRILRSRRQRKQKARWKIAAAFAGVIFVIMVIYVMRHYFTPNNPVTASGSTEEGEAVISEQVKRASEETDAITVEAQPDENREDKQAVVDSYSNIGLVNVSGYLNVREAPSVDGDIIGRLPQYGACEILGTDGEWYQIKSGADRSRIRRM